MNLLVAALGLGLLFGLGGREVRRFETLAAQDILSKLQGEGARVEVRVRLNGVFGGALGDLERATIRASGFSAERMPLFAEPERSQKGIVRELRIELSDFQLAGLRIERLRANIPDCRFDYALAVRHRRIRLSRSGVGTGEVEVLASDLEAFILRKFREIKRVSVRLEKGHVFVEGFGEFLIVQTQFFVIAKLIAQDGTKLALSDAKVFFGDSIADEAVKRVVLATITPVVDLDRDLGLFGAIHVRGLAIEDGKLRAWGDTRIPDRPVELADQRALFTNRA